MDNFFNFTDHINLLDVFFAIVMIYCLIQCFVNGFSLSLFSFMKWVISAVITIISVPKLQPIIGDYVESQFVNDVGIGVVIFIVTLFLAILIGKAISRAVTWTGVGSIDKSFGVLFGFFKGYVVSVCLFSLFNWFYPYQNWGISASEAFSFDVIKKGSDILIEEFPSNDEFIDTKEKIEKF